MTIKIGDIVQFSLRKSKYIKKSENPILTSKVIDILANGYITEVLNTSDGYHYGWLGNESPFLKMLSPAKHYFGLCFDFSNVSDLKVLNSQTMITE